MFKIYDGRTEFYQWDLDRKIIVSDPTIDEVHFCNKTGNCALVVEVYEEDGLRLANVPNIALQSDLPIYVYGYCGGSYTKNCATFKVRTRNRPADYIYTETIVKEVFTQTLEGNEEDKAPSVAAVNDALEGKVDKTIEAWKLYGTGSSGQPYLYGISEKPTNAAIARFGNAATGTSSLGGFLSTSDPVNPYHAANKQYVDDGLSKKLNKVTSTGTNTRVYGINSKGEQLLINLFTKNKQGYIPIYGTKDGVSGDSDEGGVIVTGMPEKPYHAAPMKYVDDGLAGRVPSVEYQYKLYGTRGLNAETGKVNQSYFSMSGYGMTTGDIVNWLTATNTSFDNKEPVCTIGACDPIKPIQVANKRYVDGKVNELEHGVMNALGSQYITVEVKDFGASIPIPSGAMKFAYIESLGVIKGYDDDGNELGVAEVDAINVGDTEHSIDDLPKYIEIPEGIQAISLSVTPPVETVYTQGVGGKIVFQVKVGG